MCRLARFGSKSSISNAATSPWPATMATRSWSSTARSTTMGAAPGAGSSLVTVSGHAMRHRDRAAGVSRVGYRVLSAVARHVRGGFWTESRRRLVLARDRMGIKPLYFAPARRDVYFGSELKTLFGHAEIRADARPDGPGTTIYRSITFPVRIPWWRASKSCRPATCSNGGTAHVPSSPYWSLEFRPRPTDDRTQPRRSWTDCCDPRCASTWFPTYRWACGRAAAWTPPHICITRPRLAAPSSRLSPSPSRAEALMKAAISARSHRSTAPSTMSSISIRTSRSPTRSRTSPITPTSRARTLARCQSGFSRG